MCPQFGQPCLQAYACGNGARSPGEACDDGNTTSGDGCSRDCQQVEPGWRCRVPGRPCTEVCEEDAGACADGGAAAVCGNGIVEPGEECDSGSDTSKTPHNGDGSYGGCTSECAYGAYCGDGVSNGQEACDDGPANLDLYGQPGCTFLCTAARHCGDGIVDYEEECDLGAENGTTCLCSSHCKLIRMLCPP
jgi:cysteine-rich repeat protein